LHQEKVHKFPKQRPVFPFFSAALDYYLFTISI
jgi:hypothetical protein